MLSERVSGGPPSSERIRTVRPFRMKPSWRPSGEKNGLTTPSVPGIGVGRSLSWSRSQRRVPPSAGPMYTSLVPSGEIAMLLAVGDGRSASPGRSSRLNRLTIGAGFGRNQPQSAAAVAIAAMPSATGVTQLEGLARLGIGAAAVATVGAAAGAVYVGVASASANSD